MYNKKTHKKVLESIEKDNLLKLKYYQRYLNKLNNEVFEHNLYYSSRYQLFRYSMICNSLNCLYYLYNLYNFTENDFSNSSTEYKKTINILNRKRKINKILNGIHKN